MLPTEFQADPEHWLYKMSPEAWIQAGLNELKRAERYLSAGQLAPAYAGLKRSAGMALNAALIVQPRPDFGRTYVEHLTGLAEDSGAPAVVRDAALRLSQLKAGASQVVLLRTKASEARWIDATKTVMAHAYAIVYGKVGATGSVHPEEGTESAG